MQGNFAISIPSIPNATIKFKIQDVKVKGFIAKQLRFREDKSYLAQKFINTFDNIASPAPKTVEQDDNKSQVSTNASKCPRPKEDNFRIIVDKDIGRLYQQYELKKNKQKDSSNVEKTQARGYSFGKSRINDSLDHEIKKHQSDFKPQESIIDNNYFMRTEQSYEEEDDRNKHGRSGASTQNNRPSAAFKSEDRWQYDCRILNNKSKLGPGQYIYPKQPKKVPPHLEQNPQKPMSINRIKQIFKHDKIMNIPSLKVFESAKRQEIPRQHYSSMFVPSNQDRFGNPTYPFALNMPIPGPGSYEYTNTLEEHAKKIIIVEEQRKLLKEWFNE